MSVYAFAFLLDIALHAAGISITFCKLFILQFLDSVYLLSIFEINLFVIFVVRSLNHSLIDNSFPEYGVRIWRQETDSFHFVDAQDCHK